MLPHLDWSVTVHRSCRSVDTQESVRAGGDRSRGAGQGEGRGGPGQD